MWSGYVVGNTVGMWDDQSDFHKIDLAVYHLQKSGNSQFMLTETHSWT